MWLRPLADRADEIATRSVMAACNRNPLREQGKVIAATKVARDATSALEFKLLFNQQPGEPATLVEAAR